MKVLIDAGKLKDLYSGLGQVSHDMGMALAQLANADYEFTFLVPPGQQGIFGNNVQYIPDHFFNRLILRFTAHKKFHLLHYPHQDFHEWLRPKKLSHLITVHDLNFLYTKSKQKAKNYLQRLQHKLSNARAIAAISNFTATEIKQHINTRTIPVQVIYNGVRSLADDAITAEPMNILPSFLFSIGVMHPKKNFEALIQLMPLLPNEYLVIAGGGNDAYKEQLVTLATKLGVAGRVVFTGYVSTGQKKWLYQHCSAFLFASVSEGFGLPVVEAMQFGKPVFLNHATSLPEIGSTYATYWHDQDAMNMSKALKEGMAQYTDNKQLQEEMIQYAAEFNWNKNAADYVLLYQSIMNGQPGINR
jgi:glycosyltransferase involved in cell wall biosynthesis